MPYFARGRVERELEREVASHLALMEEDFQRRGLLARGSPLAARRAYGGVDLAKELHRDARSFVWLEQFAQDLRHAARSLSRAPGFALLAILTLALGVGVNTTLFTAYNAVALRPLPVADPDRVVRLERWFETTIQRDIQYAFSYPEYMYCRDNSGMFASMVAGSYRSRRGGANRGRTGEDLRPTRLRQLFRQPGSRRATGPHVPARRGPHSRRRHRDRDQLRILAETDFSATQEFWGAPSRSTAPPTRWSAWRAEDFTSTAVDDPFAQFWMPLSMQAQLAPPRHWVDDPADRQVQILAD